MTNYLCVYHCDQADRMTERYSEERMVKVRECALGDRSC